MQTGADENDSSRGLVGICGWDISISNVKSSHVQERFVRRSCLPRYAMKLLNHSDRLINNLTHHLALSLSLVSTYQTHTPLSLDASNHSGGGAAGGEAAEEEKEEEKEEEEEMDLGGGMDMFGGDEGGGDY